MRTRRTRATADSDAATETDGVEIQANQAEDGTDQQVQDAAEAANVDYSAGDEQPDGLVAGEEAAEVRTRPQGRKAHGFAAGRGGGGALGRMWSRQSGVRSGRSRSGACTSLEHAGKGIGKGWHV
eukprot:366506-Chlamydomonas_euryale.AAC.12